MAMEPLPPGFGDFPMDASPFSSLWPLQDHYHPEESVEEVKQRLVAATVELEAAREEVQRKERSIGRLVELVRRTAKERDDAREQLQQLQQLVVASSGAGATDGESDSSSLQACSSPVAVDSSDKATSTGKCNGNGNASADVWEMLAKKGKRPLPQQGRLLQAVMEAGPLLQNLLVAGPLPRWRNPPSPAQAPIGGGGVKVKGSPSYPYYSTPMPPMPMPMDSVLGPVGCVPAASAAGSGSLDLKRHN